MYLIRGWSLYAIYAKKFYNNARLCRNIYHITGFFCRMLILRNSVVNSPPHDVNRLRYTTERLIEKPQIWVPIDKGSCDFLNILFFKSYKHGFSKYQIISSYWMQTSYYDFKGFFSEVEFNVCTISRLVRICHLIVICKTIIDRICNSRSANYTQLKRLFKYT